MGSYPTMVEIPIEIDARITPNSSAHWRTKHKIKQEMKNTTYTAMQASGPHDSLHNAPLPLRLDYVIGLGYRRKVFDDDNIKGGLKAVQDAIAVYLGINDKFMKIGTVEQVRAGKGNPGFVRVLISSEEEPT